MSVVVECPVSRVDQQRGSGELLLRSNARIALHESSQVKLAVWVKVQLPDTYLPDGLTVAVVLDGILGIPAAATQAAATRPVECTFLEASVRSPPIPDGAEHCGAHSWWNQSTKQIHVV